MPTPFQIEDALRRPDPPPVPAPPAPAQSKDGVKFGKQYTPEERALQQKALVQLLRQRK